MERYEEAIPKFGASDQDRREEAVRRQRRDRGDGRIDFVSPCSSRNQAVQQSAMSAEVIRLAGFCGTKPPPCHSRAAETLADAAIWGTDYACHGLGEGLASAGRPDYDAGT